MDCLSLYYVTTPGEARRILRDRRFPEQGEAGTVLELADHPETGRAGAAVHLIVPAHLARRVGRVHRVDSRRLRPEHFAADQGPLTLHYVRRQPSPDKPASGYGQEVEPHGRYLSERSPGPAPEGVETGTVIFRNPLHMDFGATDYDDPTNWKRRLSAQFHGLVGRALSDAVVAAGHDGIITHDGRYGISEVVDLTRLRPTAAKPLSWPEYFGAVSGAVPDPVLAPAHTAGTAERFTFEPDESTRALSVRVPRVLADKALTGTLEPGELVEHIQAEHGSLGRWWAAPREHSWSDAADIANSSGPDDAVNVQQARGNPDYGGHLSVVMTADRIPDDTFRPDGENWQYGEVQPGTPVNLRRIMYSTGKGWQELHARGLSGHTSSLSAPDPRQRIDQKDPGGVREKYIRNAKPMARDFSVDVLGHGFERVDPAATEIPDWVNLSKLLRVEVPLHEITVASQSRVDPNLVEYYRQHPPRAGSVVIRPYGDSYAVVDGHHGIIGHRMRGDRTIRARLMDPDDDGLSGRSSASPEQGLHAGGPQGRTSAAEDSPPKAALGEGDVDEQYPDLPRDDRGRVLLWRGVAELGSREEYSQGRIIRHPHERADDLLAEAQEEYGGIGDWWGNEQEARFYGDGGPDDGAVVAAWFHPHQLAPSPAEAHEGVLTRAGEAGEVHRVEIRQGGGWRPLPHTPGLAVRGSDPEGRGGGGEVAQHVGDASIQAHAIAGTTEYYHGTRYRFQPGQVLEGGTHRSWQGYGQPNEHIYAATDPTAAHEFGEMSDGPDDDINAPARVYQVKPLDPVERDEHGGSSAYRSRRMQVIREVPHHEWHDGITPDLEEDESEEEPTPHTAAEDYMMRHRPQQWAPVHNLIEDPTKMSNNDIYEHPEYYENTSAPGFRETMRHLRRLRGKPDASVTIYRAAPVGARFNHGDWVALSRDYAESTPNYDEHGNDAGPMPVHKVTVPARHVMWAGPDELQEFGYWGPPVDPEHSTEGAPPPPEEHKSYKDLKRDLQEALERYGSAEPDASIRPQAVAPDEYRGASQPSNDEPLHDLTANGTAPRDFYERMGEYADGTPHDAESMAAIWAARGRPNRKVRIYRAAPEGTGSINHGDWVTLSRSYAKEHLQSNLNGHGRVYSATVPASHVGWDGNSINEFGYFGDKPVKLRAPRKKPEPPPYDVSYYPPPLHEPEGQHDLTAWDLDGNYLAHVRYHLPGGKPALAEAEGDEGARAYLMQEMQRRHGSPATRAVTAAAGVPVEVQPDYHGFVVRNHPRPTGPLGSDHPVMSTRTIDPASMVLHTDQRAMRSALTPGPTPGLPDTSAEYPPVVHHFPGHGAWLTDGHHRLAWARQTGQPAEVTWVEHSGRFIGGDVPGWYKPSAHRAQAAAEERDPLRGVPPDGRGTYPSPAVNPMTPAAIHARGSELVRLLAGHYQVPVPTVELKGVGAEHEGGYHYPTRAIQLHPQNVHGGNIEQTVTHEFAHYLSHLRGMAAAEAAQHGPDFRRRWAGVHRVLDEVDPIDLSAVPERLRDRAADLGRGARRMLAGYYQQQKTAVDQADLVSPRSYGFRPRWKPYAREDPISGSEVRTIYPHEMELFTEQSEMRPDVTRFLGSEHDEDPNSAGRLPLLHYYPGHGTWISNGHHRLAGAAVARRPIKVQMTTHGGVYSSGEDMGDYRPVIEPARPVADKVAVAPKVEPDEYTFHSIEGLTRDPGWTGVILSRRGPEGAEGATRVPKTAAVEDRVPSVDEVMEERYKHDWLRNPESVSRFEQLTPEERRAERGSWSAFSALPVDAWRGYKVFLDREHHQRLVDSLSRGDHEGAWRVIQDHSARQGHRGPGTWWAPEHGGQEGVAHRSAEHYVPKGWDPTQAEANDRVDSNPVGVLLKGRVDPNHLRPGVAGMQWPDDEPVDITEVHISRPQDLTRQPDDVLNPYGLHRLRVAPHTVRMAPRPPAAIKTGGAAGLKLYHLAPAGARDSIAEHGLDWCLAPGADAPRDPRALAPRGIYFHPDRAAAEDMASGGLARTHDLYEVDADGIAVEPDPYQPDDAVFTRDQIPASRVRLVRPATGSARTAGYAEYIRDAWLRKAEETEDPERAAEFRRNAEGYHADFSGEGPKTYQHFQPGESWKNGRQVGWVRRDKLEPYLDHQGDQHRGSREVIDALADDFRQGRGWTDPIHLYYDQKSHRARLGEGNHRWHAAGEAGQDYVPVVVHPTSKWADPAESKPALFPQALMPEHQAEVHPSKVLPAHWMMPEQRTAAADRIYYHGTNLDLIPGGEIRPGSETGHYDEATHDPKWVYLTTDPEQAASFAEAAARKWGGVPRVYRALPGANPTRDPYFAWKSYRVPSATVHSIVPMEFEQEPEEKLLGQRKAEVSATARGRRYYHTTPKQKTAAVRIEEYEPEGLPELRCLRAYAPDVTKPVGELYWQHRHQSWDPEGKLHPRGEVRQLVVHPDYQRQGIATELWRRAKELEPELRHSDNIIDAGKAWAQSVEAKAAAVTLPPDLEWRDGPDGTQRLYNTNTERWPHYGPPAMDEEQAKAQGWYGPVYHGTSRARARSILQRGFRQPRIPDADLANFGTEEEVTAGRTHQTWFSDDPEDARAYGPPGAVTIKAYIHPDHLENRPGIFGQEALQVRDVRHAVPVGLVTPAHGAASTAGAAGGLPPDLELVEHEHDPTAGLYDHDWHPDRREVQARSGGQMVGYLRWRPGGAIDMIDVSPDYRRRGVATAMWDRVRDLDPKARHSDVRLPDGTDWVRSLRHRKRKPPPPEPEPEWMRGWRRARESGEGLIKQQEAITAAAPERALPEGYFIRHHWPQRGGKGWVSAHRMVQPQTQQNPNGVHEEVGRLSYSTKKLRDGRRLVNFRDMIRVHPKHQRLGLASAMLDRLKADYSGAAIDPVEFTADGQRWWDSYHGKQAAGSTPSFTLRYRTSGPEGYEGREKTIEGPFYHGSRSRLKPGDTVRPGFKTNSWGDEGERSTHVHFTIQQDAADQYAERAGGRVYEVEPTGEVKPGYNGDEYKSRHPLRVIREVPRTAHQAAVAPQPATSQSGVWDWVMGRKPGEASPSPPERPRAKPRSRLRAEDIDGQTYSVRDVDRANAEGGLDTTLELEGWKRDPRRAEFRLQHVPVETLRVLRRRQGGALYKGKPYTAAEMEAQDTDGDTPEHERLEGIREGHANGALPPLLLVKHGPHHMILDGSHRTAVAVENGATHVPAYVTDAETMPGGRVHEGRL